jgi:cobalt-zinc-cadmium resistance protein CzcA
MTDGSPTPRRTLSQLALKIFGDDFDELRRTAKEIADVLRTVPGTADVLADERPPLAQVVIKVDREAAARYGINVADISALIQTGIGGVAVSQVFIGERHYDVTVRFPEHARNSADAISSLPLTSSTGALVPLAQVARIQLQSGESTIDRDMNHRYLMVKLNYRDRSLPTLLAEAKKASLRWAPLATCKSITLPDTGAFSESLRPSSLRSATTPIALSRVSVRSNSACAWA